MTTQKIRLTEKNTEQVLAAQDVSFASRGLILAVGAAMLWGVYGVLMSMVFSLPPLNSTNLGLLAIPVVAGTIEEISSSIVLFIRNLKNGKTKEYIRTIKTTPGKIVCIGGILGGPIGLTGSMAAILFCGPGYALCITAMYPVFGALCSVIFLKEKTNFRFWLGLILCVAGGIVMSYIAPEGSDSKTFYLGIAFAILAVIGWGAEGVVSAYGTDTIDPDIGGGLRVMAAAIVFLIMLPFVGGMNAFVECFTVFPTAGFGIAAVAVFGAYSLMYWYVAFGMTGVSRALACNGTYGLWGILFTAILSFIGITGFTITSNLVWGGIITVIGIVLVVANPKELIQLRKTN